MLLDKNYRSSLSCTNIGFYDWWCGLTFKEYPISVQDNLNLEFMTQAYHS